MTHKEDLIRIFKEANIKIYTKEEGSAYDFELVAGEGGVIGYNGFFTTFDFNEDGSLKEVGVWE